MSSRQCSAVQLGRRGRGSSSIEVSHLTNSVTLMAKDLALIFLAINEFNSRGR
jgi:hypothetical protein